MLKLSSQRNVKLSQLKYQLSTINYKLSIINLQNQIIQQRLEQLELTIIQDIQLLLFIIQKKKKNQFTIRSRRVFA